MIYGFAGEAGMFRIRGLSYADEAAIARGSPSQYARAHTSHGVPKKINYKSLASLASLTLPGLPEKRCLLLLWNLTTTD